MASRRTYQRRTRLGPREREILEQLTLGDILIGILCSGRSTRRMFKVAKDRARERYLTKQAIENLVSSGYVRQHDNLLSINEPGRVLLESAVITTRMRLKSTSWDSKWRIVTYDIPDELDHLRYQIRSVLARAGFKQLQKSVWIFPYQCKELSILIKSDTRLQKYVIYATIETIDGDGVLRSLFNLPSITQ